MREVPRSVASRLWRLAALFVAGFSPQFAGAQQPKQRDRLSSNPPVVTIAAEYTFNDRDVLKDLGSHELFVASSANGWNPRGTSRTIFVLPNDAGSGDVMSISDTFVLLAVIAHDPSFEFKFTRGSWETVEVGADGRDIPNRRLSKEQIEQASRGEHLHFTIAGFADQRPTRWPELAKSASTVTGELRTHDVSSAILGNTRKLRVWLPPGYEAAGGEGVPPPGPLPKGGGVKRFPVLYMHDGQNCFDAATSFAGEWGVDETLTRLIGEGTVPPMIVVGIDNAGAMRADELCPVPLGGGRTGGGKGDAYVRFIVEEVMPLINREYRTLTGPEHTSMGGSSLGGVLTLHAAMTWPGTFGAILVESPALWVGDGVFLKNVIAHKNWPPRVFLAMGGREYNDVEKDAALVLRTREVEASMRGAGLDDSRLRVVIEESAGHNERAWAARLGGAMEFLFGD